MTINSSFFVYESLHPLVTEVIMIPVSILAFFLIPILYSGVSMIAATYKISKMKKALNIPFNYLIFTAAAILWNIP